MKDKRCENCKNTYHIYSQDEEVWRLACSVKRVGGKLAYIERFKADKCKSYKMKLKINWSKLREKLKKALDLFKEN